MHHPFTAPLASDLDALAEKPESRRAQAYDLVINGSEAGGGTIRIHDPKTQSQVFDLLGIDEETAEDRFGFLLNALKYGAPPHGGIALGVDRWVMLLAGLDNIQEVIAFPKNSKSSRFDDEAPGQVDRTAAVNSISARPRSKKLGFKSSSIETCGHAHSFRITMSHFILKW